nr:hypothetical protein [Clostridia bacterium]
MKHTRFIASLLALFTLTSVLASCNSDTSDNSTGDTSAHPSETTTEAVTTDYLSTIPKTDMNGRDFVIHVVEPGYAGIPNFHEGSETGDIVNDTLYRRDGLVEDQFNITIKTLTDKSRGTLKTNVNNSVLAGDETYHLILTSMTDGQADLAKSKLLYDLNEIPHLALDEAWWVPNCNEQMNIGGKLYFAASPMVTTFFATPFAFTFNKNLVKDYNIPDLYKTVLDGDWTLDLLRKYATGVAKDLDGNGTMNEKDFYGMATHTTALWAFYASSGIAPLTINDDYTYNNELGSAKSIDVITNLSEKLSDRNEVYFYNGSNPSHADMFANGQLIFADHSIAGFMINYRDMDDDWGIIPTPKYDETQEDYYTSLQVIMPCAAGIPINCSNPEETGLITEMLAYLSDDMLRNAVYDVVLTGRVTRDENSVAMLDKIYADINLDMIYIYRFGGAQQKVFDSISEAIPFASAYESIKNTMESEIGNFIKTIKGE